ncbi:MAG: alpha-N-arabinofuranosidase, partial [Paraprevotella sp.]|nr:alpha-N-arabinofuranosidase [Paraprevotella sp.]
MKNKLFFLILFIVGALQAQNFQKGNYGYLYCHMSGRGEWTAYALSRDGLHYEDLIGGEPVYDVEKLSP